MHPTGPRQQPSFMPVPSPARYFVEHFIAEDVFPESSGVVGATPYTLV